MDQRIPVYLLTGYLGSGKTSLLKAWLTQIELANSALVINELGEVGLDNQLLSSASESNTLIANACVCCTGLPGLAETLEGLFWDRLERRINKFQNLIIETTGLAEPAPVIEAIQSSELLRERYRLAGVITCLSATTADEVLAQHPEARAQLLGADVVVLTKSDLLDQTSQQQLEQQLHYRLADTKTQLLVSARSSLSAAELLNGMAARVESKPVRTGTSNTHSAAHGHSAKALWWPLPDVIQAVSLLEQIESLRLGLGPGFLRLKGRVLTDQGPWLVQMAPFELQAQIEKDDLGSEDARGLTLIVGQPLTVAQTDLLQSVLQQA
ncbi:MAG: GTP-binding protein [Burkholderiaceae bacterium]